MSLSVRVLTSQWAWSDPDEAVVLPGGDHALPNDDVKLSADLVKAIGAGVAAGALELLETDSKYVKQVYAAVEEDEISLKANAKAVESGAWLKGHLQDYVAQAEAAGDKDKVAHGLERLAELGEES